MEKEDYLPLFIYAEQPIGIYVVANEIVNLELIGEMRNSGYYAYYLLGKIVNNQAIAEKLPKKIVEKHKDYFGKYKVPWPCLAGILFEYNHCRCLAAKLEIKEIENKPLVHLSDFALMNGHAARFMVDEIRGEISLSPFDAFLLLANIAATTYSYVIFLSYSARGKEFFREYLKKDLIKYYKERKRKRPKLYSPPYAASFCLDYYEYLEEQLQIGNIIPHDILKLSGPKVIVELSSFMIKPQIINEFIDNMINDLLDNYDYLTINQRIMYYTLYLLAEESGYESSLLTFHSKRKAITKKIMRDHSKPLPKQPEGDEDNQFNVWKKYGLPEPDF